LLLLLQCSQPPETFHVCLLSLQLQ
jgi:hypothetical protein